MKKLNFKIKFLVIFALIFLAVILFNTNVVKATENKMLDVIPDTIELDIPEIEYEKAAKMVEDKIREIWTQNGINVEEININIIASPIETIKEEFYMAFISLNGNSKTINLKYNNHNKYNTTDEQYIKNLKIENKKYYEVELDYLLNDKYGENLFKTVGDYYTELVNNKDVTIKAKASAGGQDGYLNMGTDGGNIAIFKNGILYDLRKIGNMEGIPVITVPSNINDNEVNDYIKNLIKTYYNDYGNKITNITKGATIYYTMEEKIEIANGYTIIANGEKDSYIIVKKEKSPTKDISKCTVNTIPNQTYTGKEIKPKVTVSGLKNGTDYTVTYKNNKNTGKATVVITGKGIYTGTITKYFYIVPKKVANVKAKTQSTTSITLNWSKATGATGYELQKYNSSKKKWEKVTTTSKTSYTVKKLKAGTTYKFRVRAYKTISSKKYYGSYSSTLSTTTKTATPKISKITSKSKKATLSWKKVSGASGYEIYMATSKKGKYKKVKTASSKTVKYTKSSLKKKKTYYFKIRTYRTVSGKKVYSSYSSIKSIKIK